MLDEEEAGHIAKALGKNSAVILQNHGLLTVGHTVDEAAYLFGALDRLCHGELRLVVYISDALTRCSTTACRCSSEGSRDLNEDHWT